MSAVNVSCDNVVSLIKAWYHRAQAPLARPMGSYECSRLRHDLYDSARIYPRLVRRTQHFAVADSDSDCDDIDPISSMDFEMRHDFIDACRIARSHHLSWSFFHYNMYKF